MMNGVYELYSLLWFLGIKPYHKWETFRKVQTPAPFREPQLICPDIRYLDG